MKVPANTVIHEGNLPVTQRTRMSLDVDSVEHLMSVLTDLYSKPDLAVIREYSANAIDSHISARTSRPIEVTLPNTLDPTFKVKDYGVGLSVEQLTQLFSKYGWSSKRETDSEVGMLGLGCKSGLTYTSQFTITTVHDGTKTTVLVTRDTDGVGVLQVIDSSPTDEPNGLEVIIPVKDRHSFTAQAKEFYRFWKDLPVLVDGEIPNLVGSDSEAIWIDPDILITDSVNSDIVVMGGIPYPVPHSHRIINAQDHHVVAWVPIGAVQFTPSREALHLTQHTLDALKEIREFVTTNAKLVADKEISASATKWEAYTTKMKWSAILPALKLTYQDEEIPSSRAFAISHLKWRCPSRETTRFDDSKNSGTVMKEDIPNSILIDGHNGVRFTSNDKTRIIRYLIDKDLLGKVSNVIVAHRLPVYTTPKDVTPELAAVHRKRHDNLIENILRTRSWMLDGLLGVFQWEDIKASVVLDKAPRERKEVKVNEIVRNDTASKIIYVTAQQANRNHFPYFGTIRTVFPDSRVVSVYSTSVKKFLRENPQAISLAEAVQKVLDTLKFMTPEESWIAQHGDFSVLNALKGQEIDDPVLDKLVKLDSTKITNSYRSLTHLASYFGLQVPSLPKCKEVKEHMRRYPLLFDQYNHSGYTEYINAIYNYKKELNND